MKYVLLDGVLKTNMVRLIGRSVLSHDNQIRILIPFTSIKDNYFRIETMSLTEKLTIAQIYEDTAQVKDICDKLQMYDPDTVHVINENVHHTDNVLRQITSSAICAPPLQTINYEGGYESDLNVTDLIRAQPPFIRNLIDKLVMPKAVTIDSTVYRIHPQTCTFTEEGLFMSNYYNTAERKYPRDFTGIHLEQSVVIIDPLKSRQAGLQSLPEYRVELVLINGTQELKTSIRY